MAKKRYIIPIFVPHLGCPNDCIFCNQRKITNVKQAIDKDQVHQTIKRYLSYFSKDDRIREIAFYGGSFTAIDYDLMVSYLSIAKSYKDKKIIDKIRLSTRPDAIDREILATLKDYGVDIIELGVQSMDDKVLMANNRGHDARAVVQASRLIKEYGFVLGHQIMPGLYKDSLEKIYETAEKSIELEPDIVRIYPTLVVKNTRLEALYESGLYEPLSLDQAVDICADLLKLYESHGIRVIRIGLQPTENINLGADVVAGPFHPSIRQLVEQKIYYQKLDEVFQENNIRDQDEVDIYIYKSKLSNLVGNKGVNRDKIKSKFNIKNIGFHSLEEYDFYIESQDKRIEIGSL